LAAILVAAAFGFDFYFQESAISAPNAALERLQTDGAERAVGQPSKPQEPDGYRPTAMAAPVGVGEVRDSHSGSDINAWHLSVEPATGLSDTPATATAPPPPPAEMTQTEQPEMYEVLERIEDSDWPSAGVPAVSAAQQASVAKEFVAKEAVAKEPVAKETVAKKAVAPASGHRSEKNPPGTTAVDAPPRVAHQDDEPLDEPSAQRRETASAVVASVAAHASNVAADPAETPHPIASAKLSMEERLRAFLEVYCSTYTNKDLEAFSAFFTPDATEQGKPFTSMLPQYLQTFSRIETMDYRIRLVSFAQPTGTASHPAPIDLQGEFAVTYTLTDGRQGRSSGSISLGLIDTGGMLRVRTLAYTQ